MGRGQGQGNGQSIVGQRQDSTTEQLSSLLTIAEEQGLYQAADWANQHGPRKSGVPAALNLRKKHPGSLNEQLRAMHTLAIEQGCYDAADLIEHRLNSVL